METHFPLNSHFGGKLWFKYIQGNPNLGLLVAVQCMLTKFWLKFILFMSRIQACAANLRLEQQVQAADLLQCCRYEKRSKKTVAFAFGREHVEVKIMPDQYQMARQHVKHVMQFGIELQMFWVAVVSAHVASRWNRSVKNELENVQKKAGMEAISYTTWDDTFGKGTQTGCHFPTHTKR